MSDNIAHLVKEIKHLDKLIAVSARESKDKNNGESLQQFFKEQIERLRRLQEPLKLRLNELSKGKKKTAKKAKSTKRKRK